MDAAVHAGFVIELDRANPPPARDYRRETDFRTGEVSATWTDIAGVWRGRVLVYELAGPRSIWRCGCRAICQGGPPGSLHRALCAARLKDAALVEENLGKILGAGEPVPVAAGDPVRLEFNWRPTTNEGVR